MSFLDRLRPGQFISPSGVVSDFKFDFLVRSSGKKASAHEILNTDDSILQDQGNKVFTYPLECYFTGEDYDQAVDAMMDSLGETYTRDNPGILKHPRWGDIPVMPFEYTQSEQFVNGSRIGRITVEFRRISGANFPAVQGVNQFEVLSEISTLENDIEAAAEGINVDEAGPYASFSASVIGITEGINTALEPIVSGLDDVEDQFRLIHDDINTALSAGDSAVQIISQVGQLVRLPAQIVDVTIGKVASYAVLTETLIESLLIDLGIATDNTVALNTAALIEVIGSQAVAGIAEAALFTDFQTREASGQALDYMAEARALYLASIGSATSTLTGLVTESFNPDHNVESQNGSIASDTYSVLIDRSFSLAAKQTIVLTAPSDVITLTWQFYKDVSNERIEFFQLTNGITGDEFYEIAAGREIVGYV